MTERSKLRIGLLQDGVSANQYTVDLIEWAGRQDDLEHGKVTVVDGRGAKW